MGEEGAVRVGRMGSDLAWFQGSLGTGEPCKGLEQGRGAGNRVQWTPISSCRVENGLEAGAQRGAVLSRSMIPGMTVGPGIRGGRMGSRLW